MILFLQRFDYNRVRLRLGTTYSIIVGVNCNLKVLIDATFLMIYLLCSNNKEYNFNFKTKQNICNV